MRRRFWWTAAVGGWLALAGCEHAGVRPNYPRDPLLLSRRPVESKAESAKLAVAQSEPEVPGLPPTAVASAPRERLGVPIPNEVRGPEGATPAMPAVQTKVPGVPAAPAVLGAGGVPPKD